MNTTGQTFNQFGLQGMPVFNFLAPEAGRYTLSGVYRDGAAGPTLPVMIISQAARDIKQNMIVGILFFALFLVLGLWVLRSSPKKIHE